jgi:hypothetical protein
MGIKEMLGSGMLGVVPMMAKDTQAKDLIKSGMLGVVPSMVGKDMAERDRKEKEIEAVKEMEMAKRQQAGQGMKRGGKVSSASSRADGCATKGKTKGRMV